MHRYSDLLHSVSPLDAAAISTFRHPFFQSVLSKLETITASIALFPSALTTTLHFGILLQHTDKVI